MKMRIMYAYLVLNSSLIMPLDATRGEDRSSRSNRVGVMDSKIRHQVSETAAVSFLPLPISCIRNEFLVLRYTRADDKGSHGSIEGSSPLARTGQMGLNGPWRDFGI